MGSESCANVCRMLFSCKYNNKTWWGLQPDVCLCCMGCGAAWGVCIILLPMPAQENTVLGGPSFMLICNS
jgi:hypothetical protein